MRKLIQFVNALSRFYKTVKRSNLDTLHLFGGGATPSSATGVIIMIVGVVLIVAGFVDFYPLYRVVSASTRSNEWAATGTP